MLWLYIGSAAWLVIGVLAGLGVARGIGIADQREKPQQPTSPLPFEVTFRRGASSGWLR